MSNFITLQDLGVKTAQYHIAQRSNSTLSHMPHYHDYYQICLVVSGEVRHSQGTDSVTLHGNDAFIVPPGFIHRLYFLGEDTQLYALAVHTSLFDPEFIHSNAVRFLKDLQAAQEASTVPLCFTLDHDQSISIQALCDCLIRQEQSDVPPELSAAPSLVSAIINLLSQCYYHDPNNKRQPWNSADNAQLLRRCIAYVNTNYTQSVNADELAKRFGLSRSSLCTAFQQSTGLPIHKYIAQKRIEKAQMLIRSHPDMPLTQIASTVGYDDISTFYRNFVKIAGVTPSGYRDLFIKK